MTLARVYSMLPDQKKSTSAARRVFRIIERKSKIDPLDDKEGLKPPAGSIHGHIRFDNVHFHYPARPGVPILQAFTLECAPNSTHALVGPSGCGKSTLVQLLLRFYDVDSGAIYLDGVDIRDLNVKWLRSKIGLVSQEPTLFNLSILENIRYGHIDAPKVFFLISIFLVYLTRNKLVSYQKKFVLHGNRVKKRFY